MTNDSQEFENKPSSSKDMWLFLIVLDVIFLCVFGFFLYKHFSGELFHATAAPAPEVSTEVVADTEISVPEIAQEETGVVAQTPSAQPAPAQTPADKKCARLSPVMCKYVEGLDAYNANDLAAAKKAWQEALQIDPAFEDAKMGLDKLKSMEASAAVAQEKQMAAPEPKKTEPVKENPASKERQSITVASVSGSKYRRVTFRWFDPANTVSIVSGFTNRQPQALKKVGDYWETTLSIAPGTYKFLYIVNGKNTLDPYAPQKDGRSVLEVK